MSQSDSVTNFKGNWSFTTAYMSKVCAIVGPHMLTPASFQLDTQEATDLVIIQARDMRIACRVRRPKYRTAEYMAQFTVRSRCSNGAKTELQKIVEGFGDWMFYGFATDDDASIGDITPWFLIDLAAFRAHLIRDKTWGQFGKQTSIKWGESPNKDGKTWLAWFIVDSFPKEPPLVIASCPPSGTA